MHTQLAEDRLEVVTYSVLAYLEQLGNRNHTMTLEQVGDYITFPTGQQIEVRVGRHGLWGGAVADETDSREFV